MRGNGALGAVAQQPIRRGGRRACLLAALGLVTALLAIDAGSAQAASEIEGVWSFNGGEVAIQSQSDGTFVGTVVMATQFSQCFHPVGERMWTEMRLQPDGSYWGLHQWYFAGGGCTPNPQLGLTAWRVMSEADGSHFLRVCFSEPNSQSQPTIAADGTVSNATYGCSDSALISPLPGTRASESGKHVTLPSNKACVKGSKMKILLHETVGDPFKEVFVGLKSGKLHRRAKLKRGKSKVTATLNLKDLTSRTFTVKVRLTTILGAHYAAHSTYRLCRAQAPRRHRGRRTRSSRLAPT